MTPNDFPPGTRVRINFYTQQRSHVKVGTVVNEVSTTLKSKMRGCVMVRWDNEKGTVPVHPTNLEEDTCKN